MRRIDLIAKLVAPLFIAFVHATFTKAALWVVLVSNIASVFIEYVAIAQVYDAVPALARPVENPERSMRNMDPLDVEEPTTIEHRPHWRRAQSWLEKEVPSSHRSQFSATEAALQNLFEVLSFATTTVFARPEQFNYPTLISVGAIGVANICFAVFVRQNRGHLFHTSKCLTRKKYQKVDQMDESEMG
ncbi:MAG: hypothetical protein LQ344_001722 [Seirophora lacunosa]|nr:MAG: hypothetical protein LQ344_001722 [Seirophora lacunosa]